MHKKIIFSIYHVLIVKYFLQGQNCVAVDIEKKLLYSENCIHIHPSVTAIMMTSQLRSTSDSITFISELHATSLSTQFTSITGVAESQLISFVGQPNFVNTVYRVVGSSAFFINFFIFLVLLKERSKTSNITELLMINQVPYLLSALLSHRHAVFLALIL